MRCTAGTRDDYLQSALLGIAGIASHIHRRTMSGDDAHFMWHTEFGAGFSSSFQRGPVGIAAHDDAYQWFCGFLHATSPNSISSVARREIPRASSMVLPSAVTWPILRPGTLTDLP